MRELENLIERAVILTDGDVIEVGALPPAVQTGSSGRGGRSMTTPAGVLEDFSMKRGRQIFEADLIRRALVQTGGNRTHAARLLEISHRALLYKLKDYDIRD